eukprot:gnl/TRDRNA2_/TRDRNA2_194721_c0_seq1.p1 gnl/TRDRNA2_/TRDRNA2_194721_c0~~gnl/TRDRNA2_/TRDRNA2_194721_c0_seq1.p1  ORF type:complete len:177 (+),score=32.25 gnl/TRDRNA2_/TRDRNA2_194721_c0_seq1:74-604(+)
MLAALAGVGSIAAVTLYRRMKRGDGQEKHQYTVCSDLPKAVLFEAVMAHDEYASGEAPAFKTATITKKGDNYDGKGTGCVRKFDDIVETITKCDPDACFMSYNIDAGGLPNQHGEIVIIDAPGGSKLTWTVWFGPTLFTDCCGGCLGNCVLTGGVGIFGKICANAEKRAKAKMKTK